MRAARILLVLGIALLVTTPASAASAASRPALHAVATLGGRDVTKSSGSKPIKLDPNQEILLGLTITNPTSQDVQVQAVHIVGEVGGLTFFSYQISLNLIVPGGGSDTEQVTVDLAGLGGQATGLIAGHVDVLGPHNKVLASDGMVTDVRGSVTSVYAICGVAVALLTLLGFLSAIVGLARHTLPANRFARAMRFAMPALGAGLFVVFLLSAFRVVVPRATSGVPIVLILAVIGFNIGYLTPTPVAPANQEEDEAGDEMEGLTV
jgi:hypothetical protein